MEFKYYKHNRAYKCILTNGNEVVSECQINVYPDHWDISSWYTHPRFMNRGFGKRVLQSLIYNLVYAYGRPHSISYIWNGANPYVFKFIERNFGAVPKYYCYDDGMDSWDDHIYPLHVNSVLTYSKL